MDITRELKSMQAGENEKTIKQLYQEKEEILKKIFIVTILQAVNIIDKMFEDKIYDKFATQTVRINFEYEPDIGNIINFDLLDTYGVKIPIYTKNLPREITDFPQKIKDLLFSLNGFSNGYVSEKFRNDKEIWIDIDKNIGSNVLNLLLCSELKKILEYNQIQISLDDNNKSYCKKPKI